MCEPAEGYIHHARGELYWEHAIVLVRKFKMIAAVKLKYETGQHLYNRFITNHRVCGTSESSQSWIHQMLQLLPYSQYHLQVAY